MYYRRDNLKICCFDGLPNGVVTYTTVWALQQTTKYVSNVSQKTGFDISWKMSPKEIGDFSSRGNLLEISNPFFGGKNKRKGFYAPPQSGEVLLVCYTIRNFECLSIRTYARYIGRLAFVLVSGLFRHCGVKNCVVGLTNR